MHSNAATSRTKPLPLRKHSAARSSMDQRKKRTTVVSLSRAAREGTENGVIISRHPLRHTLSCSSFLAASRSSACAWFLLWTWPLRSSSFSAVSACTCAFANANDGYLTLFPLNALHALGTWFVCGVIMSANHTCRSKLTTTSAACVSARVASSCAFFPSSCFTCAMAISLFNKSNAS